MIFWWIKAIGEIDYGHGLKIAIESGSNFGTDYFLLKIKNFAERKSELPTKLAIA